jgi:prepilin-type N-terminal cleavage/methylation domain-containing protein
MWKSGMTLIEMTAVILVLLTLISILFIGAKAWKRGTDRAACILRINKVQKGVRSFANLNGYSAGDMVTNLESQVIGMGCFIETTPKCPGSGTYSFGPTYGNDTIPPIGELYMQCTLAPSLQHVPQTYADW